MNNSNFEGLTSFYAAFVRKGYGIFFGLAYYFIAKLLKKNLVKKL